MLGQFKPVAYEPFGRRRSRWHLPPWLVLLLGGIAAGALGLAVVQERYLPPRLTADASAKLRSAFEQADAERQRLKTDLATTSAQLEKSLAEKKAMTEEYASSHAIVERARDDVAAVIAALPPDPRGGVVAVRAPKFARHRAPPLRARRDCPRADRHGAPSFPRAARRREWSSRPSYRRGISG